METYYHVSSYHVSSVVLNPGTELRRSAYAENGFFKFVGILYASAEDHVEALLFADLFKREKGSSESRFSIWIREVIFEEIRKADFARHVSRCNASFLWPSVEEATRNRTLNETEGGHTTSAGPIANNLALT